MNCNDARVTTLCFESVAELALLPFDDVLNSPMSSCPYPSPCEAMLTM